MQCAYVLLRALWDVVLQTGMPMTALSVMGASWRLKSQDRSRLINELLPWAVQAGSRSADLMCLYYEKHFEVGRIAPLCLCLPQLTDVFALSLM